MNEILKFIQAEYYTDDFLLDKSSVLAKISTKLGFFIKLTGLVNIKVPF